MARVGSHDHRRMAHKFDEADWRTLRVGDRIRIVRQPTCFGSLAPDTVLRPATRGLYKRLIALRRQFPVSEIDKDGRPWIQVCLRENGRLERHWLAVDDDSWARVKPRRAARSN